MKAENICLLLCLVLVFGGFVLSAQTTSVENQLFRHLMLSYDSDSRPVKISFHPVNVKIQYILKQIQDLDEKNQVFMTNMLVKEEWLDENLRWDPKNFSGLDIMVFPAYSVWLPDIYLYNNADEGDKGFIFLNESRVLVKHTGDVVWTVPITLKSSCNVNVHYFPFDHQFCDLIFGSWTHDVKAIKLEIIETGVDMSVLVENSELALRDIKMDLTLNRSISGLIYQRLTLKFHIERKALFYAYTVIAPSILLCILTLFSFWLPCDNAEKIEVGMTVFLFLYFLQLMIAENTPESNATPLIGTFLTMVMTLNSISLVMATIVINVKKRGERDDLCPKVPDWLWYVSKHILGRVTWSTYYHENCNDVHDDDESESSSSRSESDDDDYDEQMSQISENVQCRRRRKSRLADNFSESSFQLNENSYKWFYVAQVVDKFLFEVYLLGTIMCIVVTFILLPKSQRTIL